MSPEFVRLVGTERRVGPTLESVSRHWQGPKERFLFISPHDDDAILGSGILMQLAKLENVPVYILIVTDGSMGYCTFEEMATISYIRRKETFESYQSIGIPKENIIWAGLPDCQLSLYRGRRKAQSDDKAVIQNFAGLQNMFTYYLRQIRPTQCFLPTQNDLHPDHRIVYEELLISLFHAGGDIWPELGEPLSSVPHVHEFGVYCDFIEPPQLRVTSDPEYLEKKLAAIAAFRSQKQIGSLIDIVRKGGPEEYFRAVEFRLYQPQRYHVRFESKDQITFIR
ncbi:MAG: hypothetical protein A2Y07_04925 [Planctomycetes bacterium GWF2_50_10]|nr:MAG: hypothetical protein A2Y07_04925 [Planctomycetes bacterium GWF2_50_10]